MLTDEQREALDIASTKYVHEGHIVPDLHTVVERIVAAHVRRALEDAADALEPKASFKTTLKARLSPTRMTTIWECAQWLRARAAAVAPRETKDNA